MTSTCWFGLPLFTSFQVNGIKHNVCWRKQTCNKLPNNDQNYQNWIEMGAYLET
jgi:hypothetical protein